MAGLARKVGDLFAPGVLFPRVGAENRFAILSTLSRGEGKPLPRGAERRGTTLTDSRRPLLMPRFFRHLAVLSVIAGLCLAFSAAAAAQETPLPALTGRVVDEADVLSPADEARLEEYLAQLESETSVQVVLVTVPRIEGAIEDFSLRLAEAWQIGQAETDNGALVLVSRDDRSARIEVGYGLESVIPDGLAGRIIRDELAPRFAAGDFAGGFAATAAALAEAARGEYRGAGGRSNPGARRNSRRGISTLVLVGLLLGLQLLGYIGNAFHPAGAAAVGGGIAALLGFLLIGAGALFWLVPLGLLSGFGATAFTRATAGARSGWGYGGIRGGGVLLGSSGFRGGFGGGFGGFGGGGGGFGGGGASGSW